MPCTLPEPKPEQADLLALLDAAAASVPDNLAELGGSVADPLGLNLDSLGDAQATAADQQVELDTIAAMQSLFHGELGAFTYLLFILLYMPCVATIGVIYKEIGSFWAVFSTAWSVIMAYCVSVVVYQIGTFSADPGAAAGWLAMAVGLAATGFTLLIQWGKRRRQRGDLIPALQISD